MVETITRSIVCGRPLQRTQGSSFFSRRDCYADSISSTHGKQYTLRHRQSYSSVAGSIGLCQVRIYCSSKVEVQHSLITVALVL